jgi:integrase
LAAIRPIDIQEFFNSNMRYSLILLQKIKICLSSMFEAAIENGLILKNPAKKIKVESTATPMKKRAYTEEETIDIISFAKKHKYGVPIILMLKTGLRKSEMLALRWKDIDLKNNTLTVNQSVSEAPGVLEVGKPKTPASMATLPIDDDLKAVLLSMPRNITKYDYVFHKKDGDIMRPDNWVKCQYRKFMKDYKAYYMKEHDGQEPRLLTPHELRHTFGSLIYEATRDIHITSRMMRHTNISTTSKTYVHEQFETKRTAIGKVLAFKS